MAEIFLEEIYQKSMLNFQIKCMIEEAYKQKELHLIYHELEENLNQVVKEIAEENEREGMLLKEVIRTTVNSEINGGRGDLLETVALPILMKKIASYGKIEVFNEEEDYQFLSTRSGFLTIKDLKNRRLLHSSIDPMWEARQLAKDIYKIENKEYTLRGVGLGYLAYQLYLVSNESIKLYIFEKDKRMIEYAKKYGVLGWIPEDRVKIIIDEEVSSFLKCADQDRMGYYFPEMELKNIPEYAVDIMKEVISEQLTERMFEEDMMINFYRNMESGISLIDTLEKKRVKRECIIVGAGPSVDHCIDYLRENQGKKTIIAVGTILKRLLEERIKPDFIAIMDSQKIVYRQIEGYENLEIPLLLGSFAYWKIAENYKGEKYIIPVAQFSKMEEYAQKRKINLWECGGTVTFMAMDFAIQFGAKSVSLVGIDLCYPQGMSHALGTLNRTKQEIGQLIEIDGVGGKKVYTDTGFSTFLQNIEVLIQKHPEVTYYNESTIGARIKGTIEK